MRTTWIRADGEVRAFECGGCGRREETPAGRPRHECECASRPREGDVVSFTTAPADYDWAGTRDLGVVGTCGGKPVRKVASRPEVAEDQRDRYASGLHAVRDEAEWRRTLDLGLASEVLVQVSLADDGRAGP